MTYAILISLTFILGTLALLLQRVARVEDLGPFAMAWMLFVVVAYPLYWF